MINFLLNIVFVIWVASVLGWGLMFLTGWGYDRGPLWRKH